MILQKGSGVCCGHGRRGAVWGGWGWCALHKGPCLGHGTAYLWGLRWEGLRPACGRAGGRFCRVLRAGATGKQISSHKVSEELAEAGERSFRKRSWGPLPSCLHPSWLHDLWQVLALLRASVSPSVELGWWARRCWVLAGLFGAGPSDKEELWAGLLRGTTTFYGSLGSPQGHVLLCRR